MKILILEGIATSGKTSVKKELVKILTGKGLNFSIVEENETLIPILHNTDKQTSLNFLKKIIEKNLANKKDILIFDRLYFTHIFRTKSTIEDFKEIENLIKNSAQIVFLKIDEEKIPERIAHARQHREKTWDEYVGKKGTVEQVNRYYINQQKQLESLLTKTILPHKIYNTTKLDFKNIANSLVAQKTSFIYWAPRILSILFSLFLAMFSLDIFDGNYGFWGTVLGLFMHNIPSLILTAILIISWRYEIVGAIAFITAGLLYIVMIATSASMDGLKLYMITWPLVISLPAFVIGSLFWLNWKNKKSMIK